jgi:hypothetical protein
MNLWTRRAFLQTAWGIGGIAGLLTQTGSALAYEGTKPAQKSLEALLIQDIGDPSQLPISPFTPGVGRLLVSQLVNIGGFRLSDLPNLGDVQLGAVNGLVQELQKRGFFIPCPNSEQQCNYQQVLISQVQGLLDEQIGNWITILSMPLSTLPQLSAQVFAAIPGLGLLNYLNSGIFAGLPCAPAVVELVAFRQSAQSPAGGVRYATDRVRA